MTTMVFNYEKLDRGFNPKLLKSLLSKVKEVDPDAIVRDVMNDTENKKVVIYIMMTGLLAIPEIYEYFYRVLSDYGFRNLSPSNEECMHIMA